MKPRIILLSDATLRKPPGTHRYIGPYVISNHLENAGFDCIVIDYFTSIPNFFEYLKNFITPETLFVGISSTLLSQPMAPYVKDFNKLLRTEATELYFGGYLWKNTPEELNDWMKELKHTVTDISPECKIVLGGAKVGFLWKMNNDVTDIRIAYENIDYAVIGLADHTIIHLAEGLHQNTPIDYKEKNGIKFIFNDAKKDNYCPRMIWTDKHAIKHGEALPIEVARGCVFNCKFCYFDKKESIRKPLDNLRDELMHNYEHFGTTVYSFCDDCFNDGRGKVEDICNTLVKLPFDIEWVSYARVDLAVKFPYTFDMMMEAGCRGVSWGLESFNYKAAKRAGKGVPTEKVKERLLDIYSRYSEECLFQGTFITGLPEETPESLRDTVDWIIENRVIDFPSFGVLVLTDFNPELDQHFVDYSDFVRNPQKYGLTKISFNPYYWEHETMNRNQAIDLAKETIVKLKTNGYGSYLTSIWAYPQLRNCGFSWEEIKNISRGGNNQFWKTRLKEAEKRWMTDYWTRLKSFSTPQRNTGS